MNPSLLKLQCFALTHQGRHLPTLMTEAQDQEVQELLEEYQDVKVMQTIFQLQSFPDN